ncbi:hypothetical protein HN014_19080 [Aquimarina sp. TRL1]|uniref:PDC sensor domain-containing protein n=1 Tax=Aquimarina sp. (strain TRL1) TaxID=2736252 RepID=UPI00158BD590|nr:PDC sensor domain-containing protein [Aquimarina sp. TRL1]QKX06933.1 hypothetical protein HN014_19080 [Aquimarina sp. TRL1]
MNTHKIMAHIRPKTEAITTAFIVVVLIFFSTYLTYLKSIEALEAEIKIGLKSNVEAAATTIDGDKHQLFNKHTDRSDSLFIAHNDPLEKIRAASKDIRYIYTTVLRDDEVYFVLNPSPQDDNDNDGVPDQAPALMDPYTDPAPELLTALKEQTTTVSNAYQDEWGIFISGYAPFYDSKGTFVGVLGMDLELNNFYKRLEPINIAFEKSAVIILFIGLIIGLLILYIRKHTQKTLDNSQLYIQTVDQLHHTIREANSESIAVLKKINNRLLYRGVQKEKYQKQLYNWITHVIAYKESKQEQAAVLIGYENFDLDDLFSGLVLEMSTRQIVLEISQETKMPSRVYGPSVIYCQELVAKLIAFVADNGCSNTIRMKIGMIEEDITHIKLNCRIEGRYTENFAAYFRNYHHPAIDSNSHSNAREFDLATLINQLGRYHMVVIPLTASDVSGIVLQMHLEKHKE